MKDRAEVVIIGGGIIGCSIAYQLAKKGKKALLLERDGIGEGTSSGCDGFVFMQTKKPGKPLELALKSADLLAQFEKELGADLHYVRPGGLILIENEELLKIMEHVVEEQQKQGMEVRIISGDEARAMEPCLSDNIIAAAYSDLDGHINPIDTTQAFARGAAALGVEIETHCPVTGILMENGRVIGVDTAKGKVYSDTVINACGVWAPEIGRMVGMDIPIRPRRGMTLVTEPLGPMFHKVMLDSRYIAIKHHPEMAEGGDEFLKLGVGLSIEQTAHGNILIGNSRDFPEGYDRSVTYEVTRAIARYASKFVPFLQDVSIIRTFAGLRPYCTDGYPIVGPVKSVPGMIMASGLEGDGIALSAVIGDIVSDYAMDGTTKYEVDSFLFDRFEK